MVDSYYRNYKLEFMYQYMDYFSDKNKIRQRVVKEQIERTSLKEINNILNKLVNESKNVNSYDPNLLSEFKDLDNARNSNNLDVFYTIKDSYGENKPGKLKSIKLDFSVMTNDKPELKSKETAMELSNIMKKIDSNDQKLSENDIYEMEVYKTYKNDPFFKHYLHNHLSFFSEKIDESLQYFPHSTKGMVLYFLITFTESQRLS